MFCDLSAPALSLFSNSLCISAAFPCPIFNILIQSNLCNGLPIVVISESVALEKPTISATWVLPCLPVERNNTNRFPSRTRSHSFFLTFVSCNSFTYSQWYSCHRATILFTSIISYRHWYMN